MHLPKTLSLLVLCTCAFPATAQFSFRTSTDFWTPHVPAGSSYSYDDGVADGSVGIAPGGDFLWLQRFEPHNGLDTLTHVSVRFGQPGVPGETPPAGSPITILVWDDPNGDGHPADARVVRQVDHVVQNPDSAIFNDYAVPPVQLDGPFYVGCLLSHDPHKHPGPVDRDPLSLGRAWAVGNEVTGGMNVHDLPSNSFFLDLDAFFSGVWILRAKGSAGEPFTYCTAKVNSCGTTPVIGSTGAPSASAGSGFVVRADNAKAAKVGLLIYTDEGPGAAPFQGGTLCLDAGGLRRTVPVVDSSGSAGQCDGALAIDMNAFAIGALGGNPIPALTQVGAQIDCQFWGRDTAGNSLLTGGLDYTVGP